MGEPTVEIKGIVWPNFVKTEAQLDAMRALPCRADDVFVATWPKAGTHWVFKLVSLILDHDSPFFPMEFNRWDQTGGLFDFPTCGMNSTPVWHGKGVSKGENGKVKYSGGPPFKKVAWKDVVGPRIMASHAPIDFLPEGSEKSRTIYVTRDIKDSLISMYEFSKVNPFMAEMTLEETVDMYANSATLDVSVNTANGGMLGGLAWHAKGYIDAAAAGRKIHFINYDRLKIDQDNEIIRLAQYLGVQLSLERVAEIKTKASFKAMKNENAQEERAKGQGKGMIGRMIIGEPVPWSNILYRKGERGDGKNQLTEEHKQRLDKAYAEALKEIGHLYVLQ